MAYPGHPAVWKCATSQNPKVCKRRQISSRKLCDEKAVLRAQAEPLGGANVKILWARCGGNERGGGDDCTTGQDTGRRQVRERNLSGGMGGGPMEVLCDT